MAGRLGARVDMAWRRATAPWRALPAFVIIGAQKSGTTSMYRWLQASPEVRPARHKELHYFDQHHDRGIGWYRSQFPLGAAHLTGEATPSLLSDPDAPARLAAALPRARLVALLREPAARAYSSYEHQVRKGREDRSFADALAAEASATGPIGQRYAYRGRGCYADHLARWFEHIDRDRVLVLRSEDVFAQPAAALRAVCDHVGIASVPDPGGSANTFGYRSDPPPDVMAELRAWYAPHNERLAELLGDERFLWPRGAGP